MTILTISEICELCKFVGLEVDPRSIDSDQMETEISINKVPENGVYDEDDKKHIRYTGNIAHFTEYPEEGVYPLGEKV